MITLKHSFLTPRCIIGLLCFSAARLLAQTPAPTTLPGSAMAATDPTRAANTQPPREVPADPKLPSLILIGDSTVRNGRDDGQGKGDEGQWGWGHEIKNYFNPAKINVVNRAVGGLSSRTFLTGGHWERALPLIKPGDYVVMQFGHNDNGAVNDTSRARASIKGIGEETQEIDNQLTKKHEVVHTFGWYLRKFIEDTKAKGATPVVCSLIPRKSWDAAGKINRNKSDFAGWAEQVAAAEHVPFIDLNEAIAAKYDTLGHDAVVKLFPRVTPDEHTHTNRAGADLNAQIVVAGLKAIPGNPLRDDFSPESSDITPLEISTR